MFLFKAELHLTILFLLLALNLHEKNAVEAGAKFPPCLKRFFATFLTRSTSSSGKNKESERSPKTLFKPGAHQIKLDLDADSLNELTVLAGTILLVSGLINNIRESRDLKAYLYSIPSFSPSALPLTPAAQARQLNHLLFLVISDSTTRQAVETRRLISQRSPKDPDLFTLTQGDPDSKLSSSLDLCAYENEITIVEHHSLYNFILPEDISRNGKFDDRTGDDTWSKIKSGLTLLEGNSQILVERQPDLKVIDTNFLEKTVSNLKNTAQTCSSLDTRGKDECEAALLYFECAKSQEEAYRNFANMWKQAREEVKRQEEKKQEIIVEHVSGK